MSNNERRPAVALPRKLSESWFSVMDGDRHAGYDWIYWEPHADKTAWFSRESHYEIGGHKIARRVEARFRLGARPELTWCRAKDGRESAEYALPEAMTPSSRPGIRPLRLEDALIPSALVAVIASAAKDAPGEACVMSVLHESTGEAALGWKLVSEGTQEVESPVVGKLPATRFSLLDGAGHAVETYFVDANRRLRRIEMGGPVAILTSKSAARGEAAEAPASEG